MAAAEKINWSNISRLMRLVALSPSIVDAIPEGRQPARLPMKDRMAPFPLDWAEKERHFLGTAR